MRKGNLRSDVIIKYFILSFILIILDRITKNLAQNYLSLRENFVIIPGFFSLTLAFNKGAAFSLLSKFSGWQRWFLSFISFSVSIFISIWLYLLPKNYKLRAIALSFILGGALGNFWDRLLYGQVTDFLLFYIKNYYWPAFNIADSCVCIGSALLLFDYIKHDE